MTPWSWLLWSVSFKSSISTGMPWREENHPEDLWRGRLMFYIVLPLCCVVSSLAMPAQHNLAPAYLTFSASLEPLFSIALNHPPYPIPSTPPHPSHPYPATLMPFSSFTKLILAHAQVSNQSHLSGLPSPTLPSTSGHLLYSPAELSKSPSCHLAHSWLISYLWNTLLKGSILPLLGCKLHK